MVGRRRDTDNNEVVMEEGGMLEDSLMEEEEEGRDSFLQPSSKTRFTLRKRKRRGAAGKEAADQPDGDNVSVCSLEMDQEQPESKKKKPHLSRMGSLSNILSLKKVGKMGSALQKSISSARLGSPVTSLRTPSRASLARSASTVFGDPGGGPPPPGGRRSPGSMSLQDGPAGWAGSPFRRSSVNLGLARKSSTSNLTPYKVPGPTPSKSRPTRYWSEVYSAVVHKLSKQEVKLQEAVFEIFNGEDDLVEDLKLVRKTYADSLIHLNILSPAEEQLVFGHMSALAPLHQQFHTNLKRAQCKDGFWFEIGPAVDKWIRTIESPYVNYCSNLIQAKAFLDRKQAEDKSFSDFLQRCLESPFSRKLDLWSFLDVPRSRLVKYPLLLKQVIKFSEDSDDIKIISDSVLKLEKIIALVDQGMARAKCEAAVLSMEFLTTSPPACVAAAREEILSGLLRNSRGTKVQVFLLDTALVVGRQASRPGQVGKVVQVLRDPLPTHSLTCTDLADGSESGASKPGSFHRAFTTNSHANRNAFRVWVEGEAGEEAGHTLVAPDEHTKRQWVTTVRTHLAKLRSASQLDGSPPARSSPRTSPRRLNRAQKKFSGELLKLSSASSPKLLSASKLSTPKVKSSTSKLASASKLLSPSTRLFKSKHGKSPLIKSSLSQASLARLQSGGVKKLRTKSRKTNDENLFRGAIVMDGSLVSSQSSVGLPAAAATQLGGRRSKSAAVVTAIARKQRRPGERRLLQLIDENTRQVSRSLATLPGQPGLVNPSPRYITRSTAKLSKSMNDLLQM